jgi:hypothetical protein
VTRRVEVSRRFVPSILVLVSVSMMLAAAPASGQQRTAPRGVQLVEEKAPQGRVCGQFMSLTYRACKPVRACREADVAPGDATDLLESIQAELDQKTQRTCETFGCGEASFRNDENHFSCAGPRSLCMLRTVTYRCASPRATETPSGRPRGKPPREPGSRPTAPDPTRGPSARPGGLSAEPRPPTTPGPGRPPTAGSGFTSGELDCVDPEVERPPLFKAEPAETEPSHVVLSSVRGLLAKSDGESVLSFDGARLAGGRAPQALGSTCNNLASDNFYDRLRGPQSFPAFHFPDQPCNDLPDCATAREGWMRAHYFTWAARQVIHLIASQGHVEKKKYLWKRPGLGKDGQSLGQKTSPAYWFGDWSDERFLTVKRAIDKLWGVLSTAETGGIGIELRCPTKNEHPGNVCFSKKPSAHHIVKGKVDLCAGFFEPGTNEDFVDANQGRLVAHELLHHLFVKFGNIWVAVQDTHYHGHGPGCGLEPKTEPAYGEGRIRHLATYRNSNGNDCGHPERNIRNNDTYAHFVQEIGSAVYTGRMVKWPLPTPPTPKPPECQGEENCLCEDKSSWPLNEYFEPDGDWRPDRWCPDHDGEMTCMETKYGAQTEGTCKKCESFRGPGCECDDQRPCAVGSCFGDDTFGGGVGRCFKDPPPAWQCLVDCERLFNSEQSWCYSDYPTGRARCMDHLCTKPEAFACAQQGKVCRYGECVVECESTADCQTKGYPGTFTCQSSRCEYSLPTK